MKFEKELIEIYGLVLGDGSSRILHNKYPTMAFYNYNIELMNHLKSIIKKVSGKEIRICRRTRNEQTEYSIYVPSTISREIYKTGYNRRRVPEWIMNSKFNIFFLKGLFEAEGSINHSQILISQSKYKKLLEDCIRIANLHNLSAHFHKTNRNKPKEFYIAIENCKKIKRLFGRTVKSIPSTESGKGAHYITKRKILLLLNSNTKLEYRTSEIVRFLGLEGLEIKKSYRGYSIVNRHLKQLCKEKTVHRAKPKILRDEVGRIYPQESSWRICRKLPIEYILNYPYSKMTGGYDGSKDGRFG